LTSLQIRGIKKKGEGRYETMFDKKIISVQIICLVLGLIFFAASNGFGAEADGVLGLWSTDKNESKIEIFKCGDKYCGRIAELQEPNYPADDKEGMAGKPKMDRKNPDPALRTHTILGLELMHGFVYSGGNIWEDGRIYDPNDGKTYKCKLTLSAPNRLDVRGFIGFSLLGRTTVWTR
jgi:uncharacterized protein (DUF2147 family)